MHKRHISLLFSYSCLILYMSLGGGEYYFFKGSIHKEGLKAVAFVLQSGKKEADAETSKD